MKKIILINTHLYSGSEALYQSMAEHPFIHGCKKLMGTRAYQTNLDLVKISEIKHKSNKKKSFYLDEILYNHSLSTKLDYSKCIIINFIRKPKESLEQLIFFNKMSPLFALRYYQYRLNRMYQISKLSKNTILMKFDYLNEESIFKLSSFLELEKNIFLKKDIIKFLQKEFKKDILPKELLISSEECYEKYHYLLTKNSIDIIV